MPTVTATLSTPIILTPQAQRRLATALQDYANLSHEYKVVGEAVEQVKSNIEVIREKAGADRLEIEGYTITRVAGARRLKLNEMKLKKLLVSHGLDLDLIDQCYEDSTSAAYTKITAPA